MSTPLLITPLTEWCWRLQRRAAAFSIAEYVRLNMYQNEEWNAHTKWLRKMITDHSISNYTTQINKYVFIFERERKIKEAKANGKSNVVHSISYFDVALSVQLIPKCNWRQRAHGTQKQRSSKKKNKNKIVTNAKRKRIVGFERSLRMQWDIDRPISLSPPFSFGFFFFGFFLHWNNSFYRVLSTLFSTRRCISVWSCRISFLWACIGT